MDFQQILVVLVLVFILLSLYFEILGVAFTFVVGVVFLGIFKVLNMEEILAGFSNEPMLLVIMLLLVGDIIQKTGVINGFFEKMMLKAKTTRQFMLKVIAPMSVFSAFLNNTPLVAIMIPFVQTWTRKMAVPASKLLIPLSFLIVLGGNCTLIGTSNNLIVNSLARDQKILPAFDAVGFFDFAWVGLPMLILGVIYLWLFSSRLLPDRKVASERFVANQREYMVEAIVTSSSGMVGCCIPETGLLSLEGLSLMEVRMQGSPENRIPSFDDTYHLQAGDLLIFTGNTGAVTELVDAGNGLELLKASTVAKKEHLEVIEVVVSHNSPLTGRTVREIRFRHRYGAVVLGIHRNGEKLVEKTADIQLRPGDVILLLADQSFILRTEETRDFYPLQRIREIQKPGPLKGALILGGLALVILLSLFGVVKLILGTAVYLMILLLTKIANPKEVFKSLDYNLGLIVVMTLALGTAMYKTGLADKMAWGLINFLRPIGIIGIMAGVYLTTALLAAYVNNKAALTLVFPIAILMASNLGVDPLPFALLTTSASMGVFITPHGYQTNLWSWVREDTSTGIFSESGYLCRS